MILTRKAFNTIFARSVFILVIFFLGAQLQNLRAEDEDLGVAMDIAGEDTVSPDYTEMEDYEDIAGAQDDNFSQIDFSEESYEEAPGGMFSDREKDASYKDQIGYLSQIPEKETGTYDGLRFEGMAPDDAFNMVNQDIEYRQGLDTSGSNLPRGGKFANYMDYYDDLRQSMDPKDAYGIVVDASKKHDNADYKRNRLMGIRELSEEDICRYDELMAEGKTTPEKAYEAISSEVEVRKMRSPEMIDSGADALGSFGADNKDLRSYHGLVNSGAFPLDARRIVEADILERDVNNRGKLSEREIGSYEVHRTGQPNFLIEPKSPEEAFNAVMEERARNLATP